MPKWNGPALHHQWPGLRTSHSKDHSMETISIRRDVWENMQSALAKAVHYITDQESSGSGWLDRLGDLVAQPGTTIVSRDQVAAEDATFEGFAEFSDHSPIPYTLAPRVFDRGDTIPDDVKRLRLSNEENKSFQVVERKGSGTFGFLHVNHNGGWGPSDTTDPAWEDSDFPLTEVFEDVTYSVFEAVDHLKHHGVDTNAVRLHRFLNTGAAWTDGFGFPRDCVSEYLVAGDAMPIELRFSPAGLAELVRIMKVAV
ncbi:hypothetical protein J6K27_003531 [Rhodococcus qingshengii]|uniref:hypothetical protein n=1 Tax=Rhodococcus qingshengii TaxID=334542 RepID=UPI001AEFFD91|nr:hypothetical protein [Rhodococcus qingshengii]QTR98400.1 hypothetical protein J6K27_003531 [Rhodococcus qingshengii]